MASLHAYLNFNGNCEEAFKFYQTVFDTRLLAVYRFGEMPANDAMPPVSDEDKQKIMHTALKINDNTLLMGSDCIEAFGQKATYGTGTALMLDVQSIDEAEKLYNSLSQGGEIEMPLAEQDWAERYAAFRDKFGIGWMINYEGNKKMY